MIKYGYSIFIDAIIEVRIYIADVTEDQFLQNSEKRFATIKQIEIIGEACNKITNELKLTHPEIPWRQVIGFRNISIHEYHNVSFLIVWGIAINELPVLKEAFSKILPEL